MYRQVQLQIHVDLASAVGPVSECQLTKRFTPTTEFKARPDSQVWYIIGRPMSIALWRSFNTSLEEFWPIIVNLGSSVPQVSLFWCNFSDSVHSYT